MKFHSTLFRFLVSGVCLTGVKAEGKRGPSPRLDNAAALSSSPISSLFVSHSDGDSSQEIGFSKLDSTLQNFVVELKSNGRRLDELQVPPGMLMKKSGMVIVEVRGSTASNAFLRSILENDLGFHVTGCFVLRQSRCSVLLDIHELSVLAASDEIVYIQSNFVTANAGLVESEASQSMLADEARVRFGVDGTGVKVCVMSDSFNCAGSDGRAVTDAAQDVSTGDLPPFDRMDIIRDLIEDDRGFDGCRDEGRAMMQLIHDIAPGADLGFYTALLGFSAFAQGIMELVDAGCDIIVDDIQYAGEAAFQDDLVALAVDNAVDMGVAYFASAGNRDRNSFEGPYIETTNTALGIPQVMDFTDGQEGTVPFLRVNVTGVDSTGFAGIILQWDDRTVIESGDLGPQTDLNIVVFQKDGPVEAFSANDNLQSGFAFEEVFLTANGEYDIVIIREDGPFPELVKLWFSFGTFELDPINGDPSRLTAPTIYGHFNAKGAMAVGSADYIQTPGFEFSPAVLNADSSAGGVPILFDNDGNRLDRPEVRMSPAFVGPDNTCTTFFGNPDLSDPTCYRFGATSASAPNVAGVAALMLEAQPRLKPQDIREILSNTAGDMDDPGTPWFDYGYDFATGSGFVNALYAVEEASLSLSEMKKGKGKGKSKGTGKGKGKGKGKKDRSKKEDEVFSKSKKKDEKEDRRVLKERFGGNVGRQQRDQQDDRLYGHNLSRESF
eukprot:scaffold15108_cov180-Amphora_coffeaeformis.AAC.32